MIQVSDLTFSYESNKLVLSNIHFRVETGECVAVIGYNGSGKTTFIKLLTGILKPSTGKIQVNAQSPDILNPKFKATVGLAFDDVNLLNYLTVMEYLEFVSHTYKPFGVEPDLSLIEDYIVHFRLQPYKNTLIKGLSHGTLKKVQLISAFLGKPKLTILDEPTNGLDFKTSIQLEKLIRNRDKGQTILIASHDFNFLENICDRFYLLHNSQISLLGNGNNSESLKNMVLSFMEGTE